MYLSPSRGVWHDKNHLKEVKNTSFSLCSKSVTDDWVNSPSTNDSDPTILKKSHRSPRPTRHYFLPALFFSLLFSLSIAFSSARSVCIDPYTFFKLSLYARSFSTCFFCSTPAKNLASFLSSRIAPLRSCLYWLRSFAASFRSWSGSWRRRYEDLEVSNLGMYVGIGMGLCACRRSGCRASRANLSRRRMVSDVVPRRVCGAEGVVSVSVGVLPQADALVAYLNVACSPLVHMQQNLQHRLVQLDEALQPLVHVREPP
ncbi:hypothetical protein B0H14DRAFT_891544 [Mycena olivaceomarginata]|nr:hypothetical protein B0H14DRAFT_891544 [Mycena olivaceomarginata]